MIALQDTGLTETDMFCGGGGTTAGSEEAGVKCVAAYNHWSKAIDTHSYNFPHAEHICEDVSSMTTAQIRRSPDSDFLLASPECTNHTVAKGARRRKPQGPSLFEDGPAGDDEQDRSRATMWDVVRFAEHKLLKGKPYKAIIVENVVDAYKWGWNDDGGLFHAWLLAMLNMGYSHEIVWLNSMFVGGVPQSRDRMYVVFWRPEALRKPPNLRVEPPSWCPRCERVVAGQQTFKKPEYRWGRYGAQYYYSCPSCYPAGQAVFPGAFPASTIVDETIPAEAIGERARPLAKNTRARIKRGLERLASEPFSMRLLHGVNPRPLTLPLSTQTARHDAAMVLPVGGNTYETSPGNRAKDADLEPLKTVHGSLDRALVMANRMNNVPKVAGDEPAPPVLTGSQLGIVEVQKNGGVRSKAGPVHTVRAGGQHHGVVVSNYDPGWARRAEHGPFGSVTTRDGHSLVVPYSTQGASKVAEEQPVDTITRMEKATLVMPYYSNGKPVPSGRHPVATLTAKDRLSLVVPPIGEGEPEPVEVSDADIDACRFRMFSIAEIAAAMAMHLHPKGGPYKVLGNKREQMAQYGNGVTPPVMRFLVGCVAEEILA